MSTRVTFGLVGDPRAPGGRISEEDWDRAWNDRQRVELDVDDAETLWAATARALEAFDVAFPSDGIEPVHLVDVVPYAGEVLERPVNATYTLVDEEGKAVWGVHDLRLIPYAQLVRSVEAGAMVGDARRLLLVLREPIGNGIGIDWPTLLAAWDAIWAIAERVAVLGGVAGVFEIVRRRLRRGRDTSRSNAHRWAQRGAWPGQFARMLLAHATWTKEELARLLGCTPDEAGDILGLFGFSPADEEGWVRYGDQPARVLGSMVNAALWTGGDFVLSQTERAEFESAIEQALLSGEPVPEQTYHAGDEEEPEPSFLELVSVTITPEVLIGHGRLGGREVYVQVPGGGMELIGLAYQVLAREIARVGDDVKSSLDEQ